MHTIDHIQTYVQEIEHVTRIIHRIAAGAEEVQPVLDSHIHNINNIVYNIKST